MEGAAKFVPVCPVAGVSSIFKLIGASSGIRKTAAIVMLNLCVKCYTAVNAKASPTNLAIFVMPSFPSSVCKSNINTTKWLPSQQCLQWYLPAKTEVKNAQDMQIPMLQYYVHSAKVKGTLSSL